MANEFEQIEGLDKACVIQFTCGYWRARKKIDEVVLQRMVVNNPAASEFLTGSKKLVDPAEIKKIGKIANKTTTYLDPMRPDSPVLKHPIKGMKIIPFSLVAECDDYLNEVKTEFMAAADRFCDDIETFKIIARQNLELDGLYSEMDYPLDLRSQFKMEWRFFSLTTVPENLQMISPDVYQREIDKLNETMEEVRQDAIDALRVTFTKMVSNIVDKFSNNVKPGEKKKTFHNSTINNFYDFFQTFKERDIFGDADLQDIVDKAQAVLRGKDADTIRENDSVKKLVRKNMIPLEKQLRELTSKPRRKLDIE